MSVEDKIERLIEVHFPWGRAGYPADKPATFEEQRLLVEGWLSQQTVAHSATVTTLIARLEPILREMADALPIHRFFFRIDSSNETKSPSGILEKMARNWEKQEDEERRNGSSTSGPPTLFHNFHELHDLGRFRIIVNFLSDLELVRTKIANLYKNHGDGQGHLQSLFEDFALLRNDFQDLINISPAGRKKGERCFKGIFQPRKYLQIHVEVQLMTILQEAWDKKDHFLIYEPKRRKERIGPQDERDIFAMSELLYVADRTFEQLRERLEGRARGEVQKP